MTIEELAVQITAETNGFKKATEELEKRMNKLEGTTTKSVKKMDTAFNGLAKTMMRFLSIGALIKFGQVSVQVASATSNAWIGLNSILTGKTGTTAAFEKAKSFIEDYVKDGLVPLNNAVKSYKNLALRGYSSDQIEKTMIALKNSATFARQSTYSLGEAVETATEGLKNENSIVVDNAGVTKNVAKMWESYAKSIGKSTNQLTQAEKIIAEVEGIQEETKFQMNDAAIYAETFSGRVAQLSTAFTNFKNAVGNVIQQVLKPLLPLFTSITNAMMRFATTLSNTLSLFGLKKDTISKTSSAVESLADSYGDLEDAEKGANKAAKGSLAGFDEIENLGDQSSSTSGGGIESADFSALEEFKVETEEVKEETKGMFDNIDFTPLQTSLKKLKEAFEPITATLGTGLKWIYDNVLKPLGKWTIEKYLPAWLETMAKQLEFVGKVIGYFKGPWLFLWENFLKPIANFTGGVIVEFLNAAGLSFEFLSTVLDNNRDAWDNYWSTLNKDPVAEFMIDTVKRTIQVLKGLLEFVLGVFTGDWGRAWEGIKLSFKASFEQLAAIAKICINSVIGLVNGMIKAIESGINSMIRMINTLHFDVPDWVPGIGGETWGFNFKEVAIKRIPLLERGGIVDRATTFVAGEHGKEAVMPLERNTEWMDELASRIATMTLAMQGMNPSGGTYEFTIELDGDVVAKKQINKLNKEAERLGYKPILANI